MPIIQNENGEMKTEYNENILLLYPRQRLPFHRSKDVTGICALCQRKANVLYSCVVHLILYLNLALGYCSLSVYVNVKLLKIYKYIAWMHNNLR